MTAQGWYPDPSGQAEQRWWDGTQWTSHVHGAPAAPAPPAGAAVSLDKAGAHVSLAKATTGELVVELNWNASMTPVDLDLGCLWALSDGQRGAVQALGGTFGAFDGPPYVALSGDDRSGQGGESLRINLGAVGWISALLVYAYIYEGTPAWAQAGAVVTVRQPGSPPVTVPLTEGDPRWRLCAVVRLTPGAQSLEVHREVRYLADQRGLDQAYGWGLPWADDRK